MKSKAIQLTILASVLAVGVYFYLYRRQIVGSLVEDNTPAKESSTIRYPVTGSESAVSPTPATQELGTSTTPPEPPEPTLVQLLTELIGHERLESLFNLDDIIRRFVVTVDSAAGSKIPGRLSVSKPVAGEFLVDKGADGLTLSSANFARYAPYVDLLTSVDSEKLVSIYVRHYSLFQAAYQDLGMHGYFNDRLVAVIDNALKAQKVTDPVKFLSAGSYEFADPDLESNSVAQKILIRMGPDQAKLVIHKLSELRKLLTHLNKK